MLRSLRRMVDGAAQRASLNRSVRNTFWTMLAGVWAGVLIVCATPWFVARLGMEGYGLLGLWLMMQVMMGLLDFGLGSALTKEFADPRTDTEILDYKRDLLLTLERVYWGIAGFMVLALVLAAGWIAAHWLHAHNSPTSYLAAAIRLMAVALGIQFPTTLYLNGLSGLQKHGRMSALQSLGNTLRYGGGALILVWHPDLIWFFGVQIGVTCLQTLLARAVLWNLVRAGRLNHPSFRVELVKRLWRFSIGMAMTSVVAVLLGNIDRIALSKMMPTAELGKYAVAFTGTGLLQLGIQPFYRAYFPRYAELVSRGDAQRLRQEYFSSCRLMAAVIIPVGIVGLAFAPQLLNAWLGKVDVTVLETFRLLLFGILCAGIMWLPAAFQQAHGWTSLHVFMMASAVILGAPLMVRAIALYGTMGATAVWILHGVSDITLGLWLMHRRLLKKEMWTWVRTVILPPLVFVAPIVLLARWLMPQGLGRLGNLSWAGLTGLVAIAVAQYYNLFRGGRNVPSDLASAQGGGYGERA